MNAATPALTGLLFVGHDRPAGTGHHLRVSEPATGTRLEPAFALAGLDEVRAATALAAQDFVGSPGTELEFAL